MNVSDKCSFIIWEYKNIIYGGAVYCNSMKRIILFKKIILKSKKKVLIQGFLSWVRQTKIYQRMWFAVFKIIYLTGCQKS